MKIYGAQTLYPGTVIGVTAEHLVGVPENKGFTAVMFQGDKMTLKGNKILGYRTFDDKFGRNKTYRLVYYEWRPDEKQIENTSLFEPSNTDHIRRLLEIKKKIGL